MKFVFAFVFVFAGPAFGFTVTAENLLGYSQDVLRIHLNLENCPGGIGSHLDDAIDFWNGAAQSHLRLERGEDLELTVADLRSLNFTQPVVVGCDPDIADPNGILGVGASVDGDGDNILSRGTLLINVQVGAVASFQAASEDTRSFTMAHELGHVFGLGHSSEEGALMYFATTGSKKRNLHQDDIDGIRHLYPQKELDGDYPLGCAKISLQGPPPPPRGGALLVLLGLLLIPLGLNQGLRKRAR